MSPLNLEFVALHVKIGAKRVSRYESRGMTNDASLNNGIRQRLQLSAMALPFLPHLPMFRKLAPLMNTVDMQHNLYGRQCKGWGPLMFILCGTLHVLEK